MSFGIKIRILSSKHYKDIIGLAVVFLVARFFLLHEFTQIRVSLGIAIMSIAIMYAMERKLILVLVTIAIAIMTHLSTLAMLPVVLLTYRAELKGKIYLFSFMSVIILIMGLAFDAERFSRLAPYMTGEYYVTENTLLSSYFLFKVAVLIVLLFQWKLLTTPMRNALLASAYGIFLTCIFLKNDVLSLRLGELVGVFDCLCFAYFFRHGMRLGSSYGYLGGVIAASGLYFSSIGIVNPLGLRF
jgi:hypothetical protein